MTDGPSARAGSGLGWVSESEIHVHFGKRAHNPLLLGAGLDQSNIVVLRWVNRWLRLSFRMAHKVSWC